MSHPQSPEAVFNKHADSYQDKFMDVSLYHDTLNLFCRNIPVRNARVLDIACGPGNITKYLLQQRPDLKIMGIDLAPNMLELAKNNNPEAEFQLMDCRDIGQLNPTYDAVICGFGLPYLNKQEAIKLIGDSAKLLFGKGVIYISTMEEDDSNKSGLRTSSAGDQLFIHYHQADYLTNALKEQGFNIIDLKRITYLAADGTPVKDLVIIAGKG